MSARIQDWCAFCSDRVMAHEPRLLRLSSDRLLLNFWCPQCGNNIVRPIPDSMLMVFVASGIEPVNAPEEVLDHPLPGDLPPVDDDDLIAFGGDLYADDFHPVERIVIESAVRGE